MTARLDFTSVTACAGGGHFDIGLNLTIDGNTRTRTVQLDRDILATPVTNEELETFVRLNLKIMRAQNPANLRTAILNKVIDLGV